MRKRARSRRPIVALALRVLGGTQLGCSGGTAGVPPGAPLPSASWASPPPGITDYGGDPAVVEVEVEVNGAAVVCAGALVAPDAVLTARHCVAPAARETACSAAAAAIVPLCPPASVGVRAADVAASPVALVRARGLFVPPTGDPCAADLAVVLLEQPVDGVAPFALSRHGIALGAHVRSVDFARQRSDGLVVKRVRDHVAVTDIAPTQLLLDEGPCGEGCGGPLLDDTSGELVGVLSRAGPSGDVATRTDVFLSFLDDALTQSLPRTRGAGLAREKKGPVDLGASCAVGSDCAAGVCVTDGARVYCSRACSRRDPCPSRFRCASMRGGGSACAER